MEYLILIPVIAVMIYAIYQHRRKIKDDFQDHERLPEDHELVFVKWKDMDLSMPYKDYYTYWNNLSTSEKNQVWNKRRRMIQKGKIKAVYYGSETDDIWVEVIDEDVHPEDRCNLKLVKNYPRRVVWMTPRDAKLHDVEIAPVVTKNRFNHGKTN